MTMRRFIAASCLLALAMSPIPARAAESVTWTATMSDKLAAVWDGTAAAFGTVFGWLWPGAPDLRAMDRREGRFHDLIGLVGYGIKGFQTSIGLIPSAGSTFQLVREMSDADYEEFDLQMIRFEQESGGPIARFQRMILMALVDAQTLRGAYKVDRVELWVLPLPQATFHISPARTVLSEENDALLRAIESLREHFQ